MIVRVRGRSMVPTLHPDDILWARRQPRLRRAQVVILRHDEECLVKRVIGLPGESIEIRGVHVIVNGVALDEPYILPSAYLEPLPDRSWNLLPRHYVLLGDARDDSLDSRRLGPIPMEDIIATAVFRVWPHPFAL